MSASNSPIKSLNILCAIDSFKGTISSELAGQIVSNCAALYNHKTTIVPISDGGEGLLSALRIPLDLEITKSTVLGPNFKPVVAETGYSEKHHTLVIEMALASGLPLLQENEKNPLKTTSYGTGELIKKNIRNDTTKILIGVGGSATSDGGAGAMQAIGVKFEGIKNIATGDDLTKITDINTQGLIINKKINVLVACDVNNPFTGNNGAAKTYGYQKCAETLNNKDEIINKIETGMLNLENVIKKFTGIDLNHTPGSGAAGGIAGTLHAIINAKLTPGIDLIFDAISIDEKVKHADLIITGEGCLDHQTLNGKVVSGILANAKKYNKPVIGVFGQARLNQKEINELGFHQTYCLIDDNDINTCLNNSEFAMDITIKRLFKELKLIS